MGRIVIAAVAALAAWVGVQDGVDSIVYYVFAIVDKVPADPISILQPIYNPPPMYTHAYRPLSTALVKLGSAAFGRTDGGLQAFTLAHGLLLVGYGLAARRFLRTHGFDGRVSTAAALTALLCPTVLFSAWTIPEFDMVGGIFVLLAAAELRRGNGWGTAPFAILALLTKETSAVLMLAYFMAHAALRVRTRWRVAWLPAGYLLVLLAVVSPIFAVKPPVAHDFNVAGAEFHLSRVAWLAFHNASQVLYVLGPAGALLLAHATGRRWLAWPLLAAGLLLFAASPLLRHYNQYESIVFSNAWWVLLWVALAFGVLGFWAWRGSLDDRTLSIFVLLGFAGLLAGPVLASFARADLSARLYAPLIPALHGLAWRGGLAAVRDPSRIRRLVGTLVVITFAWTSPAGAVSAWQLARARFPVERAGKTWMYSHLEPPCPLVFYPNRYQELAQEEMGRLVDVPPAVASCTRLIQLSRTQVGDTDPFQLGGMFAGYDQNRAELAVDEQIAVFEAFRLQRPMPASVHLYVQTARSAMDDHANAALRGDFEWAIQRLPEIDVGHFEQTVGIIYAHDTPIERLFRPRATQRRKLQLPFFLVPLWLNELPRRLLQGLPFIEDYDYMAAAYGIPRGVVPRILDDEGTGQR